MYKINILEPHSFPKNLLEIPEPPKELWYAGILPAPNLPLLAVVGSRRYSDYGQAAVEYLLGGLAGYRVGIVSGLALGIDGLAHEAALKAGLYTLAVPGSGLDAKVLYPANHRSLADKIIASGGGLLSELSPETKAAKWTFPQRNRIMAGLCQAVLMIEAEEKSGTLITARLTADYNRELLVVPGNIFSSHSQGTHQFLKLGATPITTPQDIIDVFHLESNPTPVLGEQFSSELPPNISKVLSLLKEPLDKDTLIRKLELPTAEAAALLMEMELKGQISNTPLGYRRSQ